MKTILILGFSIFLSGCVILPIPNRSLAHPGIQGRVVSSDDQKQVGSARITSLNEERNPIYTDNQGHFFIPPSYQWHGALMLGPLTKPILPAPEVSRSFTHREILITHEDYHPKKEIIFTSRNFISLDKDKSLPDPSMSSKSNTVIQYFAIDPISNQTVQETGTVPSDE